MARRKGVLDKTWQKFSDDNLRKEKIYYRTIEDVPNDTVPSEKPIYPRRMKATGVEWPAARKAPIVLGNRPVNPPGFSNAGGKSVVNAKASSTRKPVTSDIPRRPTDTHRERPKSARPQSRLGVYSTEHDSDLQDADRKQTVLRPKSARPESRRDRLVSSTEENFDRLILDNDVRLDPDLDLDTGSPVEEVDRPSNRLGHHDEVVTTSQTRRGTRDTAYHNGVEGSDSVKPTKGILKKSFNVDTGDARETKRRESTRVDSVALSPASKSSYTDIDLQLDPVLFFLYGEEYALPGNSYKSALSAETINAIGGAKTSLKSNPPIGSHGSYHSKSKHSTENERRYHRNRSSSLQNALHDNNQSENQMKKRNRIKSDTSGRSTDAYRYDRACAGVAQNRVNSEPTRKRYDRDSELNNRLLLANQTARQNGGDQYRPRYHNGGGSLAENRRQGRVQEPKKLQPISSSVITKY